MIDQVQVDNSIDLNVHGIVGIRLIDATSREAEMVARQVGAVHGPLSGAAEITIRFVDRDETTPGLRYLGLDDAAYDGENFYVIGGNRKLQIPFGQIGKQCEIVCERGAQPNALLSQIVNLTALEKGAVALHGAAFRHRETNCLAIGWPRGGKTAALLASLNNGAEYIAAEWVYLADDGRKMCGVPESIRVRDWHLRSLPDYRARVATGDRLRLGAMALLTRSMERAGKLLSSRLLERLIRIQKSRLYLDVPAEELVGSCVQPRVVSLDKILFVVKHSAPETVVRPMGTDELVQRLAVLQQEERAELMAYYRKFRFAFPSLRNECLETVDQREFEVLKQSLSGKPACAIYHPYDASLDALADAINSVCEESCSL